MSSETGKKVSEIENGTAKIGLMARLRAYFITGLLVTAPISITVFLVWKIIEIFDNTITPLIPVKYHPETYLPFTVPGLGLVLVIVSLTIIGFLTAGFLGRSLINLGEWFLGKMPVVRSLYGGTKQIFETVLAQKSESFRQVVLVEYPRRGLWVIGFVSGRTSGEIQHVTEDELVSVFVPTTPNPTSGFLIFFPKRELHVLEMTVEEGIKMVVSSGIITPDYLPKKDKENLFATRETIGDLEGVDDNPHTP